MKRSSLFLIIATAAALGCTTSCTQGDDRAVADGAHGMPISFNVGIGSMPNPDVTTRSHDTSGGNVSAPTRGYTTGAANNSGYTFSGGEYMTIAVTGKGITTRPTSEVMKQYTVASGSGGNNSLTYQKDADGTFATSGFDWLSTSETVSIRAWSDGKTTPATPVVDPDNNIFTIETTQNGDVKELLYSKSTDYYYGTDGSINIPLYHQCARIVVKINDDKAGTPTIADITIGHDSEGNKIPTSGTFAKPGSGNLGSWSSQGNLDVITPKLETTVTGYDYIYSAVVIPGDGTIYQANKRLINIKIGEEWFVYRLPSATPIEPGKQYTFDITVKNQTISVTGCTINNWGNGSTGGTVTINTLP